MIVAALSGSKHILLLCFLALAGCLLPAPQRVPEQEVLGRFEHYHVVAIQTPPLIFPMKFIDEESLNKATHIEFTGSAVIESVTIKMESSQSVLSYGHRSHDWMTAIGCTLLGFEPRDSAEGVSR